MTDTPDPLVLYAGPRRHFDDYCRTRWGIPGTVAERQRLAVHVQSLRDVLGRQGPFLPVYSHDLTGHRDAADLIAETVARTTR